MDDDRRLEAALGAGDEAALTDLVERLSPGMLRAAVLLAGPDAAAEVVRETWLAAVAGLGEGRDTGLRAWVYGLLPERARQRDRPARRPLAVGALRRRREEGRGGRVVRRGAFEGGGWVVPPPPPDTSEERLDAVATRRALREAVRALPRRQREVLVLRDVAGLSAPEACRLVGVGDDKQRVLLHRARSGVRAAVERQLAGPPPA